ncbi:MAG: sulfite exporter TauE/SafE family protein [Candidatus Njordarchaeales archaeon]
MNQEIQTILVFVVIGFVAQMVDGALGIAYGVTSTTFLLTIGISPVMASVSVHTAEIFTSGVSGLSHLKLQNVDYNLFKKLVIPGVLGGVLGAYVLTAVPGNIIKPFVTIYLLIMGLIIVWKALKNVRSKSVRRAEMRAELIPLGIVGGFLDAIGGGGWGPIVTSTLVARGNNPRYTVGSVNLTEFFITIAEVATLFMRIKLIHWQLILGLIAGGIIAAPLAAFICKKLPPKVLMVVIGLLIMVLSVRILLSYIL